MKKIGFVIPWFGMDIPGGAEAELRGLTQHLQEAGVPLEILTTCVKDFNSDWSTNYHKEGESIEGGLLIRRFSVRERDTAAFHAVNYKLMNNLMPLTDGEEEIYVREMVNSPNLYSYMEENKNQYGLFVFIPYMFGTTYFGCQIAPEKSVLIPCFHDESYVYMRKFADVFSKVAGLICHSDPELELAKKVLKSMPKQSKNLGEGVYTDIHTYPNKFREKYQIESPFILYAGRKDAGKKVDVLIKYFYEYKKRNDSNLQLVLIGGGEIAIPNEAKTDVIDLGFVSTQDKYNAYGAAEFLCQPSHNESFSLVIMESWLCHRPVLVSGKCKVTKDFAIKTNGGLWFDNYFEFESCVNRITNDKALATEMADNGEKFVKEEFSWDKIVEKYTNYFEQVVKEMEDE